MATRENFNRRRSKRTGSLVHLQIAFTAIGLLLALWMASTGAGRDVALAAFLLLSLMIPTILLVGTVMLLGPVAVHELGHYLAGRSVGFRFVVAAVGPFGWRQEKGRIVRFRPQPVSLGGYVAMVPEDSRNVEARTARFILGGPVASVALVLLMFGAWKLSGLPITAELPRGSEGSILVGLAFRYLAAGSLLTLPGTLLPYRIKALGGLPTDMLRLIALRRGDPESRSMIALLSLQRMLLSGVPAGELPRPLLDEAELGTVENAQRVVALQMRWAYEIHHDLARADALALRLESLVQRIVAKQSLPKDWLDGAKLLQAENAAYARHDADGAETRLANVEPTYPGLVLAKATILAAIAALRKEPDLDARIATAESVLREVSDKTSASLAFERRWLSAMRRGWPLDPTDPLEDDHDQPPEAQHQGQR